MKLGDMIKIYRESHSISMDAFSQKTGLSKSYVSMLERNKDPRGNEITPSIETIYKVAKGINKSFDDVFRELDQNQKVKLNSKFDDNLDQIILDFQRVLGEIDDLHGLPPERAIAYIKSQLPLLQRAIKSANFSASPLSDDETELLSKYRELSEGRKKDLIKFATIFFDER